jgi:drug/metabolite transporter (DMT)-like permease
MKPAVAGSLFATVTGLTWGGQFVVGKSALGHADAFHLNTVRYGIAAAVLLLLLVLREGRGALRLEGRGRQLFVLGAIGFAGFNLLAYTGLEHATPQSAALITALAPLLTALVLWQRDPLSILTGSVGWGDALVLGGVVSFVVYTLGAAGHRDLSPLRFTALTAGLGWLAIAGATVVADLFGVIPAPSAAAFGGIVPQLAYISLLGAVVAVLAWNESVRRIGPQNAALFGNLIPVTAFGIAIVRGYEPRPLELVGAGLTLAALVAANLVARRPARTPAEPVRRRRVLADAA